MDGVTKFLEVMTNLDEDELLRSILDREDIREFIIFLNTEKQLFEKGINSLGGSLGIYTQFTIEEKKKKGQPFDRVTLRDTGEFHESWEITVTQQADLIFDADDEKQDTSLFEKYGIDILGLTEESLEVLIDVVKEEFIILLKSIIIKNLPS